MEQVNIKIKSKKLFSNQTKNQFYEREKFRLPGKSNEVYRFR